MKTKNIILILLFMFISANCTYSMDFYPELGADPFQSSLNPENTPDDFAIDDENTMINFFKNRKAKKEQKEKIKEEKEKIKESKIENESPKINILKPDISEVNEVENEPDKVEKKKITFVNPIKKVGNFIRKPSKEKQAKVKEDPKIELSADYMEYFPDRYEVEAVGNAKVEFTKEQTVLTANKIVYNYDRNVLKAKENVVLISSDTVTEGDFIKIDLSNPDGWVENPITTTDDIRLSAKEAFIYSDRIEEYDGVAKILKNEVLAFRANSFASFIDRSGVLSGEYKDKKKYAHESGVYKLKANTIYIEAKKDHDVVTIKNADLYLKNYKIASIPSTKIVSNKQNTVVEANVPEIGSRSLLGAHIGPSVVLNVPGGSTLKLSPVLTYGHDKLGIGGMARYRNAYNVTEVAYGTSYDELLVRGRQKIAPGLILNYSRLTNQNEWFLGFRKPKYGLELNYSRKDYVKDLKLHFSQRYSAGVFVDYRKNRDFDFKDAEGRFRWMTQTYKPVFTYKNEESNIGVSTGLVGQTAASIYTTGDVVGLFRVGPALKTQVGPWSQSVMYLLSAGAGQTPFYFDRYRYGRSNVILMESLKICRYLSVGYLASLAMNRDYRDDDLLQENRFFVSVGPEYARVSIGYDAVRQNTMFVISMLVGTKDSEIEFKKSVIQNPESVGKKVKKKKTKKKNYKKYLKDTKKSIKK